MTNQVSASGTGSVLPPGTLPKVSLSNATSISVVVLEVENQQGMTIVKTQYPDGFVKNHNADTVEQLLGKITNQLKGRYGVASFSFDAIPSVLAGNEHILLKEITYDALV